MMINPAPLVLTFKLSLVTTVILFFVGVPLSYWLAFSERKWKCFVEPLVSMPLILPPTVLGFYILLLFSPRSPLGGFLETVFHIKVVFTFLGLVIGSVLFSLPFMVNPVKAAFQSFPKSLIEASYALGRSRRETLFRVILPNIRPALLSGAVMAFAHTVGEFGVVLMVGGNIPEVTRTASIAIFNDVEALNYTDAGVYSMVLFVIAFIILFVLDRINRHTLRAV